MEANSPVGYGVFNHQNALRGQQRPIQDGVSEAFQAGITVGWIGDDQVKWGRIIR
jgi:hypothetical protein